MSSIYDALQRLQEDRNENDSYLPEMRPPKKNRTLLAVGIAVILSSVCTAGLVVGLNHGERHQEKGGVSEIETPMKSVPGVQTTPVADENAVVPEKAQPVEGKPAESSSEDDPQVLLAEAQLLQEAGQMNAAGEIYARLIELQPEVLKNYLVLGTIYYGIDDYDKALVVYTKAMRFFKDDAVLLNNMGGVLLRKGNFDAALGYFRRASELSADDVEPVYNMACAYALKGDREQAVTKLRDAARMHPDVIRWASKDKDLQVLRGDTGFDALFEG